MCWSEEVSWLTFSLGMIASVQIAATYMNERSSMTAIALAWQPVVWMQFFEALVWSDMNTTTFYNYVGSHGATYTALLQPPIMGIILLSMTDAHRVYKQLSAALIITYIYWYSESINTIAPLSQLSIYSTECRHIDFAYWKCLNNPDLVYSVTVSLLFVLLIPEIWLAMFLIAASAITYAGSFIFYNCGESNGSMWCWVSACMPLYVAAYKEYVLEI